MSRTQLIGLITMLSLNNTNDHGYTSIHLTLWRHVKVLKYIKCTTQKWFATNLPTSHTFKMNGETSSHTDESVENKIFGPCKEELYEPCGRKSLRNNITMLYTHNVSDGRSLIFTLVKGIFTIIKKGLMIG